MKVVFSAILIATKSDVASEATQDYAKPLYQIKPKSIQVREIRRLRHCLKRYLNVDQDIIYHIIRAKSIELCSDRINIASPLHTSFFLDRSNFDTMRIDFFRGQAYQGWGDVGQTMKWGKLSR